MCCLFEWVERGPSLCHGLHEAVPVQLGASLLFFHGPHDQVSIVIASIGLGLGLGLGLGR